MGRLVQLLGHTSASVLVPALRTVGNIVTGSDEQTQQVVDESALMYLKGLLETSKRKSILKETCWTISNITAGTKEQVRTCPDPNLNIHLVNQ